MLRFGLCLSGSTEEVVSLLDLVFDVAKLLEALTLFFLRKHPFSRSFFAAKYSSDLLCLFGLSIFTYPSKLTF